MPPNISSIQAHPVMGELCQTLKRHPKRIVFPDGEDIRVLHTAARMVTMEIGVPILLGNKQRIEQMAHENGVDMTFVSIIEPAKSCELELFVSRLAKMSRYRKKKIVDPNEIITRPHNFAAMMVQYGHADGMVAGNASTAVSVFRAALSMIKPLSSVKKIFGVSVLIAPDLKNFGKDGVLLMADCGVIPKPDIEELASIALETGKLASRLLGRPPRVAMLSHSTKGSAGTKESKKIAAATELARINKTKAMLEMQIDGEIQADVALDAAAAEVKLPNRTNLDPADVLVFPNLDAGHIALKLLEHVAGVPSYGQLLMGLTHPAAQVPTTVTEDHLLGTAILVAAEAIKSNNRQLEKEEAKNTPTTPDDGKLA
ncbi:MAG: phosphate acyltransferase [Akkermansiaceae bacterium]